MLHPEGLEGKTRLQVAQINKLQIGHAYRITGSVSDIGTCQEGMPILGPQKITEVKVRCKMSKAPEKK